MMFYPDKNPATIHPECDLYFDIGYIPVPEIINEITKEEECDNPSR